MPCETCDSIRASGDDQFINPVPGSYYVSCVDGPRKQFVCGPFMNHCDAIKMVGPVKEFALTRDAKSHFYQWGTAGVVLKNEFDQPVWGCLTHALIKAGIVQAACEGSKYVRPVN